mmetsp:Transcript_16337/g.44320  ORF Transcript_16337/g.44320 Transcript_16337/m.44320 type:complete len:212 (+) Transcript_16337:113-748(+)
MYTRQRPSALQSSTSDQDAHKPHVPVLSEFSLRKAGARLRGAAAPSPSPASAHIRVDRPSAAAPQHPPPASPGSLGLQVDDDGEVVRGHRRRRDAPARGLELGRGTRPTNPRSWGPEENAHPPQCRSSSAGAARASNPRCRMKSTKARLPPALKVAPSTELAIESPSPCRRSSPLSRSVAGPAALVPVACGSAPTEAGMGGEAATARIQWE